MHAQGTRRISNLKAQQRAYTRVSRHNFRITSRPVLICLLVKILIKANKIAGGYRSHPLFHPGLSNSMSYFVNLKNQLQNSLVSRKYNAILIES